MKEMMKKSVGHIGAVSVRVASWFEYQARRVKEDKRGGLSIVEIALLAVLSMAVIGAAAKWATDGGGVGGILGAMSDTVIKWIKGSGN